MHVLIEMNNAHTWHGMACIAIVEKSMALNRGSSHAKHVYVHAMDEFAATVKLTHAQTERQTDTQTDRRT